MLVVCCLKTKRYFSCTSTMALQQAQTLLSMNSLEAVNVGVQQNNTESFAVVLCHLAELHAEQVSFRALTKPSAVRWEEVWVLLTQGARLALCFFLPLTPALGAETMQVVRWANPFPEGWAEREGSRTGPGALISLLLRSRGTLQLLLRYWNT